MGYREHDARAEAREALARRLTQARALADRDERRSAEREIFRALAALELPRRQRTLPPLPLLPQLRISSPCLEPWDGMEGDARVRHCSRCERDVFDLSAMTRDEIEELLRGHLALPEGGLPCVRFYRRADGTVLTADCPVAAPVKHAVAASAAVAVAAALALSAPASSSGPAATHCTPPHAEHPRGSVQLAPEFGTHAEIPPMITAFQGLGMAGFVRHPPPGHLDDPAIDALSRLDAQAEEPAHTSLTSEDVRALANDAARAARARQR